MIHMGVCVLGVYGRCFGEGDLLISKVRYPISTLIPNSHKYYLCETYIYHSKSKITYKTEQSNIINVDLTFH